MTFDAAVKGTKAALIPTITTKEAWEGRKAEQCTNVALAVLAAASFYGAVQYVQLSNLVLAGSVTLLSSPAALLAAGGVALFEGGKLAMAAYAANIASVATLKAVGVILAGWLAFANSDQVEKTGFKFAEWAASKTCEHVGTGIKWATHGVAAKTVAAVANMKTDSKNDGKGGEGDN